jgi:YD repeat-containing protein
MKTNQANYENSDGSTRFYYFTNGRPLHWYDMESHGIADDDGGYGLKLFYESRGYSVTDMYNQYVLGYVSSSEGFTYEQYKAEIDAGRPTMIHLEGHTMVGVGYDDASNLVYLHDTWDRNLHTMIWGGIYSGMEHCAVTIVHLAPLALPPAAPTGLVVESSGSDQIDLTWMDNSDDESSFRVERSPDGSTGWAEVGTVPTDGTTHSDTTLTCGTTYYYRVRAHRSEDGTYSAYSDVDSDTTDACPLAAPTGLAAETVSATQIDLTWTDNSSNESSFRVERSADGETGWAEVGTVLADGTVYSDTTLACETTYYYRLRAHRSGDGMYSPYSVSSSATTLICGRYLYLPLVVRQ